MTNALSISHRPVPMDFSESEPFDARVQARNMLRSAREAALATLDRAGGFPYSTVTNLSVEPDGGPVIYASQLSHHGQNMLADSRISITLAESGVNDVLRSRRLTLVGHARRLEGPQWHRARARYQRKFSKSARYLNLGDALLFRLEVVDLFLNGGPARYCDDLRPADLVTSLHGADELMRNEQALIELLQRSPERLEPFVAMAGGARGRWRVATIDPDGMDLAAQGQHVRITFARRVKTPADFLRYISEHSRGRSGWGI